MSRRVGVAERRARLATRHHLATSARADEPVQAARGVVGYHATDPTSVYLQAWARLRHPTMEAIERALYDERRLVRMLAMRRTMFAVPVEDAPLVHAAASVAIARAERRNNEALVRRLGVDDPASWLDAAEQATLAALSRRGEATAQELALDVEALRAKVPVNQEKAYAGEIGMSSRVLLLLALEGRVVRGRPRGTWVSSQYRWASMERWLGRPMPDLPVADSRAEIVRRWLWGFGPGSTADLRWWTGWTAGEIRAALAAVGAVEVDLDGHPGHLLPEDMDMTPTPEPWAALLPALDATTMGWQGRDWYLGAHRSALFDTNGNAGPTIWVDGRVVGGWAVRAGGEVVSRLLEDVGTEAAGAIDTEAARLTAWLGGTTVVPRFPTPLLRELVG